MARTCQVLAQTCQSRPYRVSGTTSAPVAAKRVVPRFRYQYLPRVLRPKNKEKRVERSPPGASSAGMIEITKLVHFSVAAMNIPHHNVTIGADDCITATRSEERRVGKE